MESSQEPAGTAADRPPSPDADGRPAPACPPDLLRRLRAGDPQAFQVALRPHLPALLGLARRLTGDPHQAEDLVQETLVQACRGLHGYRGQASLRTWLLRILIRQGSRPPRRLDRLPTRDLHELQIPAGLHGTPDQDIRERELGERLAEALERLTRRQRSALHLRAVEGLDYRSIAEVLGGSAAAARMLVLAARRQVMRRMGRHLEP